ncbi:MAG: hypothetical protein DRJ10_05465 [Bacteroidetes bacterium]|nr:MAG: hypothetical protein DRJ10_05465 [Bacteroidota bacterium]
MDHKITGIVDIPLKNKEDDKLQMKSFEMALYEFIQYTSTPITIALQGEWGSGKTSLMNRLDEQICQAENAEFYSIWLNTWHHALMKNEENILISIINALIEQVIEISRKEHPEKLKQLIKDVYKIGKTIFKGLSKVAVKTTVSQVSDDAADVINETLFNENIEENYNLNDLRNKLGELIAENIKKNEEKGIKKKAFIFFIDDLDRIDPALAVNILELLKNIFDINNCIFILAIDYDVVVKGLKSKFGELNESNEREFRSFFDKIIQLPFQMPVSSYVIDNYIREILLSVNIINDDEAKNQDFIKTMVQFTGLSIGTNPRSIKRLVNTLSFINLLIKSKNKLSNNEYELQSYEKQLIFALICLQTGFPAIYNLLADNADIEHWSDEFAQKHNLEITDNNTHAAILNEKWQHILYAVCVKSPYLNRHFFDIVNIFKQMQIIADENNKSLYEILSKTVALLSVTSTKAVSKPIVEINSIRVLYALNQKLIPSLQSKLREPLKLIERKGRMIAKLNYKFDEQKSNNSVSISVFVNQNNYYLKIGNTIELFSSPKNSDDSFTNLERWGTTELFSQFVTDFENLNKKYSDINFTNKPRNGLYVKKQKQVFEQYFQISTQNIEYFYTSKFIDNLSDFIIDFMLESYKMVGADWQAK